MAVVPVEPTMNREVIQRAIATEMLSLHNHGYSLGHERESFDEPPNWMMRKAGALADAVLAVLPDKEET